MTSIFHLFLLKSSYTLKRFRKKVMKNIQMLIRDGLAGKKTIC